MSEKKNEERMDRREFLQSTAAAGAGLVLAPSVFAQSTNAKKDNINVALLGVGEQGQVLLNAIRKMGENSGIRFKAVCDIWQTHNQKRVSRMLKAYKHEHNTYIDYKEMLDKEKDLDAVIIATPDFWHSEHAVACLKAGLHVYCEKEMSNTLDGAKKMVQAAKETGKLLQIGHQRRSNPIYQYCYDKIIKESQLLNRITTINGQWNRAVKPDRKMHPKFDIEADILKKYGFESMAQFLNWRWYKGLGGGPIVDLGSHQIDIFSWFLEANPKAVMASGGTDYYDKKTHQWYDTVMAVYEFQTKKGVVRAFYQTLTTNSSNGYFEKFMGDEGTLVVSESAGQNKIYREKWVLETKWEKWVKLGVIKEPAKAEETKTDAVLDSRETIPAPSYELPVAFNDPYHQPHLKNFFDAIRGKAKLNCPAEIGYETAVAVLKVNEAIEKGCKLEFKPEEFSV